MPHINRIRVNNVKYNFGTQFYDDFLMRFSCKNTIYDLANGGGKSVLMLLLLQNLIPNCTLDDKQPIEKLFRTHEGSTTIHSLIEWTLSDVHVKDNFKYMLTGFCARKAKDRGEVSEDGERIKNGSSIEYFNYCIFYRKFNDNDIKNLPLSKDGERVTYTGLKNYLKDLAKNDMSLEVRIFEKKGDYQRFIAGYGLYESEWEIIRGINKTEGHVRTYFETNYKTTRKVVEDLLIEEIIEKSFRNNYLEEDAQDKLAETLLNIKDKLLELSRKKSEINNFDRQIEIIDGFKERTGFIKQMYLGMEDAFEKLKRIHNSIMRAEKENGNRKDARILKREETLSEKKELGRKVETAKVLSDKEELKSIERELAQKEEEYAQLGSSLEEFLEQLGILEGGNYYLEYIEAKKEYDKLILIMDNLLKDNHELLGRLKEKVALKKISDDRKKSELLAAIEKEEKSSETEKDSIESLAAQVRRTDHDMTITEYELKISEKAMETITKQMMSLKNETTLLLPSDASSEYEKKKNRLEQLTEEYNEINGQIEENSAGELELKLEYQRYNQDILRLEQEKQTLEMKNGKLLNSEEKLNKLKEVYQENDVEKLGIKIEKAYRNIVFRLAKEKEDIEKLEYRIDTLKDGKPIPESEALTKVSEYILRYHTKSCISGADYLAELDEKTRIDAIRNNPVLPYAVIVSENFSQIISDWEILKLTGEGICVPIINAQSFGISAHEHSLFNNEDFRRFVSEESILDNDRVICMVGSPDRFTDEKQSMELEKLKRKLKEFRDSYERKAENEDVVREDYLFVQLILNGTIDDTQMNPGKAAAELEEQIKKLTAAADSVKKHIHENDGHRDRLLLDMEENEKNRLELKRELENLEQIGSLLTEYKNQEETVHQKQELLNRLSRDYNGGTKRLLALKNMADNRRNRIRLMQEELQDINRKWEERYKTYFDEGIYGILLSENRKAGENLDIELDAIMESLVKENSSVADKEKLLNNYQISMQRSLQRIDYLGLSDDMFDNMYKRKELFIASPAELQKIKHQADDVKQKQKEMRKALEDKRSLRDKLQGKIAHSISLIGKNYGKFDESLVKSEEISTFLNENGRLLLSLEERIITLNTEIKEIEENEMLISVLKKDSERLMEKSRLNADADAGLLSDTDTGQIEKEYHLTAEQLDKFINEKLKRTEEFERDLSLLIDTLKKLGADELASEMRMNVSMPLTLDETSELVKALKETNSLIELEKQRVLKGLEDIQVIKDNFENQCIQSCVNIKTELDRLSRLSKITMDGENITIINLKIPYISEELYKDRMSEYIDRLAKGADIYEKQEEKLKYIRNNLCWKKMFSVIVSDMNGIRMNLYKRERIAGQSRYLPYEEAVGSTGQSQGIYIQFLIAIINYISSINSKNADATRLRKVIFIDNPFGAAKDIYIWEPIFKLLKTNNVQLIVPARGATPAITGRFDVNYVLGQKMCDGKQQTVVVDYFSNVNHEELDYTTLSYEQTALF